jgi:NAD(P)-dependent dehydrogenase (short-subunit alcohol dehydrogenase family)
MDIRGRDVLILGGGGLVGMAVARELMPYAPGKLVISALTQAEAEQAVAELKQDGALAADTVLEACWGDLFLPDSLKDRSRADVLANAAARGILLDDLYGELTDAVLEQSAFGALLLRARPAIVVDCINTATAFAYQDLFNTAARVRQQCESGSVPAAEVEGLLATMYLPQLIRHVQIALEGMRRAGTGCYVKVGTAGTGGMGLNIPFTHSEERPSRMLLAKASVAGAQTLLLYLMARTPGAPAVKEVKPTAAISWKRISFGEIHRRGRPVPLIDSTTPLAAEAAFAGEPAWTDVGRPLSGVFVDAGENGLFSIGEFETLTALGLMEFITPEEIATNVVREILGQPTGKDVVAALDAATSGPTYRAGVLREVAMDRMAALEAQHGVEAVAYEMLGPPRLSKLLFECAILGRLHTGLREVATMKPSTTAKAAADLVMRDADLRRRMLTIGLPIVLPDGSMLRGPNVKIAPEPGQAATDPRLADAGWVDLRPSNWRKWSERAEAMLAAVADRPGPDSAPGRTRSRAIGARPSGRVAWRRGCSVTRIGERGSSADGTRPATRQSESRRGVGGGFDAGGGRRWPRTGSADPQGTA